MQDFLFSAQPAVRITAQASKRFGNAQGAAFVASNAMKKIQAGNGLEIKILDRRVNRNRIESTTKNFCQTGTWSQYARVCRMVGLKHGMDWNERPLHLNV